MPGILSSLACNLDADILSASFPLLEEGRVEALEWSFDTLYKVDEVPTWFTELLQTYSREHRLIGHGVFFSLFSGKWSAQQREWLQHLRHVCSQYHFDHITEHFGFMTGKDFHQGAPLNIPYNTRTLAIGRDRLAHIQDACRCPVGLENLAFAYSLDEVKRHGEFLNELIEPVNGFIILDLHNLYCQLHNFSVSYDDMIELYPLHRVREIHISGGSWQQVADAPGGNVRRDTHDSGVPPEVFELLEKTIPRCYNLKYVVMEQLGMGLRSMEERQQFYNDFIKMQEVINKFTIHTNPLLQNNFLPKNIVSLRDDVEDVQLYMQQQELSRILESADNYEEARHMLNLSSLANSDWHTEEWAPYMLQTAMSIAHKWKEGWA